MNKIPTLAFRLLRLLCLLCAVPALEAYDLRNPALNKVRFQAPPSHGEVVLVEDGRPVFAIAYDSDMEKEVRARRGRCILQAVEALRRHVGKSLGREPETIDLAGGGSIAGRTVVLVGDSRPVRELGVDVSSLPPEGFAVRSFPGGVVIAGNDSSLKPDRRNPGPLDERGLERGTLWGVYDFLERFLGCRFYFPGEYGSLHPHVRRLAVAPFSYTDHPYLKNRGGYYLNVYLNKDEDFLGRLDRTLVDDFYDSSRRAKTVPLTGMHSPFPEEWAKANPDLVESSFFRNQFGHRYHSAVSHVENYYDVTSLRFADDLVRSLKRFYDSGGKDRQGWHYNNDRFIVFGQTDTRIPVAEMRENAVVKRENLITQAHLDAPDGQVYSDVYGRFWQHLAEGIRRSLPGRKLVIMPYSQYFRPPLDPKWRLPDNVEASVCLGSIPRWIRNPRVRSDCLEVLKGWYRTLGDRPVQQIWTYNAGNNAFVQAIATQLLGEIPKAFGKYLGDTEIFHEFNFFPAPELMHYFFYYATYVGMRAQWNPDFDGRAALDEHWRLFYGEAAGRRLKAFHDILWDSYFKYASPECRNKPLYPPAVLDRLQKCLDDAERLLPADSVESRRFRLLAHPMRHEIGAQKGRHAYNIPYYRGARVLPGERMAVDGVRDEPVWDRTKAIPLRDFNGSPEPRRFPPDCRIAWSDAGIHVFVDMPHEARKDGKAMWSEDVVEFFLAPGLDKECYFQFCFDPHLRKVSMRKQLKPILQPEDFNWRCRGLEARADLEGKGWRLEFFIPFEGLGCKAPRAYQSWNFNLVYDKMSEPAEVSSSAMTLGNNHNVDMYGVLVFASKGDDFR